MFQFNDMLLELDDGAKVRTTADGYMAAMPRVARTGIQLYRGSELGMPNKDIVRIYRPESEVFKKDSASTFTGKPFTDDHPKVPVNAKNWKDYSVGIAGEDVLRDGEFVRVPMILMDGKAIAKVKGGKTQLSVGYTCDIAWGEGTTPDGQVYDGQQKDITVNHIAIVTAARGGDKLNIGDANKITACVMEAANAIRKGEVNDLDPLDGGAGVTCLLDTDYPLLKGGKLYARALRDAKTKAQDAGDANAILAIEMLLGLLPSTTGQMKDSKTMKTLVVDGITCEMTDTAVEVVQRALRAHEDAAKAIAKKFGESEEDYQKRLKAANDSVAELTTKLAASDAKVVTLESQLKDAAITPEKIDALVKDRAEVGAKAKALVSTVLVDGKSVDDIMKQVVVAKLGDKADKWDASQIKVSFDTLTAGVDTKDHSGVQRAASAFSVPPAQAVADSEKRYDTYDARLSNQWKDPSGTATRQ